MTVSRILLAATAMLILACAKDANDGAEGGAGAGNVSGSSAVQGGTPAGMSTQATQSPGAMTGAAMAPTGTSPAMPPVPMGAAGTAPPTGTSPATPPPMGAAGTAAGTPPLPMAAAGSGATSGMGTTPAPPDTQMPAPGTMPRGQLPPTSDYKTPGPFHTKVVEMTGPGGTYTMIRPEPLGENGFKHPILTWGNGLLTTPALYPDLLSGIASHGIVVIGTNSITATSADLTSGLDWLIAENDKASSDLYQKLDTARGVSMGFSLGGAAAVGAGAHPSVVTTIALHPAPGAMGAAVHGPLLLFSGTADTICPSDTVVQPVYDRATVPTFYANLEGAVHDECILTGGREYEPSVAWLRLQLFGDDGARDYFYGPNCKLCGSPWVTQRKNGFK